MPMRFEHLLDTPPDNLSSRLKHRGWRGVINVISFCSLRANALEHFAPRGEGGGAVSLQTPKLFGTFWDIAKNVPNNFGIICRLYDLDPKKCTVQFLPPGGLRE